MSDIKKWRAAYRAHLQGYQNLQLMLGAAEHGLPTTGLGKGVHNWLANGAARPSWPEISGQVAHRIQQRERVRALSKK